MAKQNSIIVFTKNPEKGKVKTRLAATIGDDKALKVYKLLLHYTAKITKQVNADKITFYADYIGDNTYFHKDYFSEQIQEGSDLGEKMYHAFNTVLKDKGYKKAIILGGDCYELSSEILTDAFKALESNDAVIGPAKDGGYYLLGLKKPYPELFLNKKWSTDSVFKEAIEVLNKLGKTYYILPTLSDIDYEEDLGELKHMI